ncbi:MAG: NAD-dependent epimerase/dehydratase family protein [Chthoniobacterales bacterium]|nr:NAD-dependent epimerase/dehydratase family protein [Chthoniobacterales bacterium]
MSNPPFFSPLPREDLEHVLTHTKPLWEQMRGGRIFVTGATGFFGIWLLETFLYANEQLKLGAELVGLSRNPAAFAEKAPRIVNHPAITMHAGDVRDFIFPSGKFSHVIHAGTTSSVPVSPLEMLDTIIQGTRRALDFAVACEAKRFLFVSSGAVYGELSPTIGPVSETCPTAPNPMNPSSAYGEGKRVAELLCVLYHEQYQLKTTVARCFAFAGPHLPLDAHFALGNFVQAALEKKPIVIKSDGSSIRSYLYAADLVVWLWTILFQGKPCHPYNVGSERGFTIREVAEQVHQECHLQEPIRVETGGVSTFYVPSTQRAQRELGLKEYFSLRESIRKHRDWLRK